MSDEYNEIEAGLAVPIDEHSRRDFLRGAVTVGAALAIPATILAGAEAAYAASEADVEQRDDAEGNEELHSDAQHEISFANWASAIPVALTFANIIKRNADEQDDFILGAQSLKLIAKAEAARIGVLHIADPEARYHELEEIGISYGLMGALVALSEATEHLEADEDAIFDGVKKLGDELDNSLSESLMPAMDASKEAWAEYAKNKERTIVDVATQNYAMSAIFAPTLTTYTTATLGNAISGRMARHVYELNLARSITDESYGSTADAMSQAVSDTEIAMNGPMGYVKMILTYSGNIQGAGGLGDPPNLFLMLRRGPSEWLKASQIGLGFANVSAAIANEVWLTKELGLKDPRIQANFIGGAAVNSLKALKAGVLSPIGRLLGNTKAKEADALFEALKKHSSDWHEADSVREALENTTRPGLSFDQQGFKGAFSHYFVSHEEVITQDVARRLHSQYIYSDELGDYSPDYDQEIGTAIDVMKHNPKGVSSKIKDILREMDRISDFAVVEDLAQSFDAILDGGDVPELMNRYQFLDHVSEEQTGRINDTIEAISEKVSAGERDGDGLRTFFKQLIAEHAVITDVILPHHAQEALIKSWADTIVADSEVHEHDGGLSHAAQEVLAALSTQILAATSASVLAQKILAELGDRAGVPVNRQREIVEAMTIGLSAVADNVVAYIFGENVLTSIYEGEYGELSQEDKQILSQSAWLLAIAGGAHSKIGNGPNFKMQYVELYPTTDGDVDVERRDIPFADSLKNGYAGLNSAVLFALDETRINRLEKNLKERQL